MDYNDLTTLGIAFGLGLLVGLQRQRTDNEMAGVRTFTLIAVLGVIAGFLTRDYNNPYILPILGLCIAAMLIMANYIKIKKLDEADVGQTTEVAALLMFAIGAYLVVGSQLIGVLVGASMAILLYVKEHLHDFIEKMSNKDLSAIMTLAGISLIVLPILPDRTIGPLDVINPKNIWLMVTLIVGISVFGYFIYKLVGKKVGIISNGILGGLISSTATTVSYARKTKDQKNLAKIAVFVITAASAVSMVRVLVEVAVVVPEKLPQLMLPLIAEIVVLAIMSVTLFYFINKDAKGDEMPEPENPAQLKSAIIFGLLYGFILLLVAFTKRQFGEEALYIVSIISGLTDVDAITLSLSQMVKAERLQTDLGWKLILLAAISNLVFKGVMAIVIGAKDIAKWVALSFGISVITGLLIIWLWPQSWHF
ncbi:MgtC/SapB family protein [Subsaxibacter sp. CAU 1640]|uniref:MgtC/SapB family protein n=1 Tax=Subsaxibacter sp. CAU 1640 TaxID=2933271 RepID=UPI002003B1A7|nr:MgtC/SapB family protein [Subsaxibacter sp. CAU 1640]MCK7590365.1 MgtC/SapB family protein [Subsaxibacter sp. CAU 1640]